MTEGNKEPTTEESSSPRPRKAREDGEERTPGGPADFDGASDPSEGDLLGIGDNDAIFEALWARVVEAWDDDRPHAAIVEHALRTGKLPDLAGRYRALKDHPEKGPRAAKKIDAIVVAATQMLMATRTPTRTKTPWQWTVAAVLAFALVCAFLGYQLFAVHRH